MGCRWHSPVLHNALYDKFLFVGITRAASYLGLTSEGSLPPPREKLRTYLSTGDRA